MMGGDMWAWILLWVILGVAVVTSVAVVVVRALGSGHKPQPLPQVSAAESPAVREAKDALKMRYAKGEIDREEYLQRKVELED